MRERVRPPAARLETGADRHGWFRVAARMPTPDEDARVSIRVLLADDQASDPGRLPRPDRLRRRPRGRRRGGRRASRRALARSTRADVVLMDIRMPGTDGLAATRAITADEDLAGVRVLVLTTFEIDEYVVEAIRAGASGFIGKGADPAALLDAIRVIAAGDALLVAAGHPEPDRPIRGATRRGPPRSARAP